MILTNPFTGQVLNANPKGCNQYSGPECSTSYPRSDQESWDKLVAEAGVPVKTLGRIVINPPKKQFAEDNPEISGRVYFDEKGRPLRVRVSGLKEHPLSKAALAHEVGHIRGKRRAPKNLVEAPIDQETGSRINFESESEAEAWKWALKNRRTLGVSKKDLLKLIRSIGVEKPTGERFSTVKEVLNPFASRNNSDPVDELEMNDWEHL